uniref:Secreted protein n=1 Tax=Mesocestoides corti TaxID=53468 RepID=A0A5K3FL60_MESCO
MLFNWSVIFRALWNSKRSTHASASSQTTTIAHLVKSQHLPNAAVTSSRTSSFVGDKGVSVWRVSIVCTCTCRHICPSIPASLITMW